ncbi:MAG: type VI secretion system baseplate subunit TssF [Archangium sp.]|nr:type VI secretion system baseplate subunit TssF [Archangium sp.]
MFSKFYQSELAYLRDIGRAFSAAHPTLAPLLSERSTDPDVERLLEGFAFLTARIQERVQDAVPELSHELAQLLIPHYLRPVPSCAVVEFSVPVRNLRGPVRIPRGTELSSTPVEGTVCHFRTTDDAHVMPLTLSRAQTMRMSSSSVELRLSIETTEPARPTALSVPLRLYLHGDLSNASALLLSLKHQCRGVSLRDKSGKELLRLPADAVALPGFRDDNTLFPWPSLVPLGYARVLEYFSFPQKFLFVDVHGLEKVGPLPDDSFELTFLLNDMPIFAGSLSPESFRLSCVPVVNLFSTSADPLRQTVGGQELFIRPAAMTPQHAEVFSVDEVVGVRRGERTTYQPFGFFPHLQQKKARAFYQLRRSRSVLDLGSDTTLVVGSPLETRPFLGEEVFSIDLTCTNRLLAGRVGLGDINKGRGSLPAGAKVKNITPATQPIPAPLGTEVLWRLISHLSVMQRTLVDEQALRGFLELYNLQVFGDVSVARANTVRVDAIRKIQASPIRRLFRGAPVQGTRLLLELEEKSFASLGDVYLFGSVLNALFGSFVTMNSFAELTLKALPSQSEFTWPLTIGTRQLQ